MLKLFINLDRSLQRKIKTENTLQKLGLSFERVSAVDGKELSDEYISKIQYSKYDYNIRSRYTRLLTKAEIGCFLSHKKCWIKLLESHENFAVIIEDALKISARAKNYLKTDKWIPEGIDIIRLNCYEPNTIHIISKDQIAVNNKDKLVCQLKPKPLGTQGYIISRKAAEIAVTLSEKIPCPVDDFLFTPLFEISHHFKPWQIDPCLVCRDTSIASDIGNRNNKNLSELKAPF
ncbi:MAG: glycosyltransferase family 25 protein, partial [Succinatimonas sp.]|nr:glycosyltransferase family 25 protein [Succinatimonas sp.]